jgi:hypothetical protein
MIDPDYAWAFLVMALAAACFVTAGWLMNEKETQ